MTTLDMTETLLDYSGLPIRETEWITLADGRNIEVPVVVDGDQRLLTVRAVLFKALNRVDPAAQSLTEKELVVGLTVRLLANDKLELADGDERLILATVGARRSAIEYERIRQLLTVGAQTAMLPQRADETGPGDGE